MYAILHPSNFFAQAAAHQRPELRKWPFVVLDGEPPTEVVFAANHAARSQGVEIGMNRLQAEAFSGSSRSVVLSSMSIQPTQHFTMSRACSRPVSSRWKRGPERMLWTFAAWIFCTTMSDSSQTNCDGV